MSLQRPEKGPVFLSIAHQLARLGTCDRKQVGCVIVRDGRCISWGFNGAPPGLPHCSENNHGHPVPYEHRFMDKEQLEMWNHMVTATGCRNATHAEANALAFAARQGISTDGATVYVTLSPCPTCSRLLIAAGIVKVVWAETYRDPEGSRILEEAGIEKEVLLPDEYVPTS